MVSTACSAHYYSIFIEIFIIVWHVLSVHSRKGKESVVILTVILIVYSFTLGRHAGLFSSALSSVSSADHTFKVY